MTNEEAIKLFKDRDLVGRKIFIDEAIDLAIEALEKQIPKTPINVPGSLMGEKFDQYFCPNCYDKRVELYTPHTCMMDYNVTERIHCCPLCGQAIDWSNE